MYDPETGAAVFASTQELHLKYSELGYTHTNPIMIGGDPVFPDATQYTSPLPTTGSQGSSTSSNYERSIGSSSSY